MDDFEFRSTRNAMIDAVIKNMKEHPADPTNPPFTKGFELARHLDSLQDFETVLFMRAQTIDEMNEDPKVTARECFDFMSETAQIQIVYAHLNVFTLLPRPSTARGQRPDELSP